ncbi:unnamed protein product [Cuscuta epithymum]|uniref:Uncharacterized protein n=1 Tax=Cuscuta epithymum TaxID=186058 RepID=A0AAV0EG82_9ASTE|nr:unnamed protein product [Cuscuta epithymum]
MYLTLAWKQCLKKSSHPIDPHCIYPKRANDLERKESKGKGKEGKKREKVKSGVGEKRYIARERKKGKVREKREKKGKDAQSSPETAGLGPTPEVERRRCCKSN